MKKLYFVVMLGLVFFMTQSLYAQNTNHESEYYYVSVSIEKIYVHSSGYMVTYLRGFQLVRTFIPHEWFSNPDGKADMIQLGTGSSWPTLTIYYRNGQFSHVRLYVRKDRGHQTWGVVPFSVDIENYFVYIEEVPLES
ncbi:MAG: hypothetical protein LBI14_09240 [Treponema sp.]|jgi:hypothetical protein|nr:hypothetical protein [Treponema sp.]